MSFIQSINHQQFYHEAATRRHQDERMSNCLRSNVFKQISTRDRAFADLVNSNNDTVQKRTYQMGLGISRLEQEKGELSEFYKTTKKTHEKALLTLRLLVVVGGVLQAGFIAASFLFPALMPVAFTAYTAISIISLGILATGFGIYRQQRALNILEANLPKQIQILSENISNGEQALKVYRETNKTDIARLSKTKHESDKIYRLNRLNHLLATTNFKYIGFENNFDFDSKDTFKLAAKHTTSLSIPPRTRNGEIGHITFSEYAEYGLNQILPYFPILKKLDMPSIDLRHRYILAELPQTLESLTVNSIDPNLVPALHIRCPNLKHLTVVSQEQQPPLPNPQRPIFPAIPQARRWKKGTAKKTQ